MNKHKRRSLWTWTVKSMLSLLIVMGMLLPNGIMNTTQPVSAHNLDASAVYIFFDPDTQAMLDARIAAPGWTPPTPLLQNGDTIGLVIKAVPDNGTTTGVGGYTTFYIPNGAQVIDAAFLAPVDVVNDGITGYDRIAAKGQALIPNVGAGGGPTVVLAGQAGISRGPNIVGVTANLVNAANVNNGTLPGVYGDLGIFYSTAPETAYGTYTAAPATGKRLTNNSGDWVGYRTSVQAPLNLWDVWQMAGFGIAGTTDTGLPASPRVDSNGRGNTIWGNASAVAGPQSGYAWDFELPDYAACAGSPTAAPTAACVIAATDEMGPWQRIRYPGSQIAYDIPGDTRSGLFAGGLDGSTVGYALSPSTPLTATTGQANGTPNAIRFAYGQLTNGRPEYAWVKLKVNDYNAMFPSGDPCPSWRVDTFGGDAGGSDNGKDHIWRYYDPNGVSLNACLAIGKPATRSLVKVGDYFQYNLKVYNAGNANLTNVVVTDSLPAGVTFVSAVPAQNSGPNPLRWVIGSLPMGQSWEAVVTVKTSGTGVLNNTMTATGQTDPGGLDITATTSDKTVSGAVSYLRQNKSVSPNSAAPGATVTYTIQIDNIGTGATGTPVLVTEQLPPGFTYTATPAPTARINGAVVTPAVNATNPAKPVFTIPAALQAGQSLYLTFSAQIAASQTPGSYCNNYITTSPGTQTTGALACVTVAGGKIGDTIFRDWNGNGSQDAGEEGIAGVTVKLYDNSNNLLATTTTDSNGNYYFPGLVAGTYVVEVNNGAALPGTTQTGDPDATLDNRHTVTLVTDQQYLTADFGYKPTGTASIGDKVFEDIANNGVFDAGDTGIPNVTVWLYEDSNNNGVIDTGDALVATTQSNASGDYLFSTLAAGYNYLVKVDKTDADIQTYFDAKYGASTPFQLSTAEVIASPNLTGNDLDNDFGFWRTLPASIGDQLFVDANRNGAYDAGETPLANVTVVLYRDGQPFRTTVSGPDGKYLFANLGPGDYTVMVDTTDPDLPGNLFATVLQYNVSLTAGQNYLTADFPFVSGLTKTVDKAYATTGQTLNFTLKPYYPGSDLLQNVRIIDPLPAGTTYVASSANAGGTFGAYTPLPAVPGRDDGPPVLDTAMSVNTNYVLQGNAVNVTLNVKTSVATTNVSPTPIEVSGGAATCTGPTPASANLAANVGQNFVWACTLHDVGEYIFSAGAENNTGTVTWPDASSASVLSSPGGGPNVVTWNLGSNAPGVPGETFISGYPAGVYAFRGANTREFSKYVLSNNAWATRAQPTNGIEKGGALTVDSAAGFIYALEGNSRWFYRYNLASNTWTRLADTLANTNKGGAAQYLSVSGTKYVYALLGNSNLFSRYNVASNTWTALATTPANVKKGGALTTDGTNLYALQGDRKTGFWRYNVASNTWTALASTPDNVGWGGSLTRVGNYIYALQGDGKRGFWRYDIAANTWTTLALTPGKVGQGGALTTDGTYLYALQGKTLAFWRYDIAANTWTTLAPANFTGNVGQGGALVYDPGVTPVGRFTTLTALPSLVSSGDTIQVTLRVESSAAVNNVAPGALTQTPTGGASAACTGPSPASQNIPAGGAVTFTWSCAVTPGANPGSLTFSANATGAGPVTFPTATSRRVLVSPVLTYQATVNAGAPAVIRNTGILAETSGAFDALPSNTTETATSASIGDRVWADVNGNGAQDSGEVGLASVKVYVDSNANGVWDTGEPYAITDASGAYRIYGLSAGTYTVRTDPATYPTGYLPTTAPNLSVNLSAGQQYDLADFGLKPAGAGQIGDYLWLDADADGVQDADEAPLPGIGVTLERYVGGAWVAVATTTTGADGKYLFTGLIAGDYRVTVNPNSLVTSPYGGSYTLGSAMTPTYDKDGGIASPNGVTSVTLESDSTVVTDVDFGYRWAGSTAGSTWYDTDGDGLRNETDCSGAPCGAPGSTIILYLVNADGSYTILDFAVTADPSSYTYLFANLPPGHYVVGASEQEVPAPSGSPNAGQVGTMVFSSADHYEIFLGAGQNVTNRNFGFVEAARLTGTLFHDVNYSAALDAGEPGLVNIVITLSGYDNDGNPVNRTAVTNASGEYVFLVPPGNYTLSYDPAAVTAAYPGLSAATTPTSLLVSAEAGHEYRDLNFGVDNAGKIGDRVWNDANGNGSQDAGEVGLPGVTVYLCSSAPCASGNALATTVTDANGAYQFLGLADGTYYVAVNASTLPSGFTQTYDNFGAMNDHTGRGVISGGNTVDTVDFGYHNAATYAVSGTLWHDVDGEGDFDETQYLANVTVCLYNSSGAVVACTVTNSSGVYTFPGIPNGTYTIRVDATTLPSVGYAPTYDPNGIGTPHVTSITVSGAPVTDQNFGYQERRGSISGSVCVSVGSGADVGNGICDTGEPLVANVTITLRGAGPDGLLGTDDDTTQTTTTNSSGAYQFTNLLPGLYQVLKTNPANTTSVADRDGGNPDNITVNLGGGQTVTGRDFEVDGGADLAVTKSDGLTVVASPQNGVVYTLVVVNNGILPAAGVVLTDTVGAGLTYVSNDCSMTGSGPYVWNIGTLAVGASVTCHVTVNVNSGLSDGTTVTNYAHATTTTYEPNITNNEQADINTVQTAPAPDLQITKSDGQTRVLAGASLTYNIAYNNAGNAGATGVVIVDTLPANVDYVSSSPSGTYDSGAHTLTWNIGDLAASGSGSIQVNVTVKNTLLPGAVVLNRVSIGGNETDRNPLDNSAVDSDIVVAPYIVLEKSVSGPAYVGAEVTYTIAWANNSDETAAAVVITDTLPANTTLVAGSITGGGTYDSDTRTLTWNLGSKAAGASGTVSFKVTVNSGVTGSAVSQTAPTLSTETGSGSVTITSTTTARASLPWCATDACRTYRGIFLDTNPVPPTGWNDNPRATVFDQSAWTQPVAASTAEYFYWMSAANLNAEWTTINTSGLTYPNYTYFRQTFCMPLNASGFDASLVLAGDDISTIYLNGVPLGQHQGAGSYSTFSGNAGIQSGINLLAVQLVNNTHGGHPSLGGQDHSGLLFNLQASYSSLRPFIYAPAMALAGQEVTFAADQNALGGRTPYYYRYDWGDGTVTDYTEDLTSATHTYSAPGTYIATVTARAQYGCTGSDQVTIVVLPTGAPVDSKILGNTAHVAYENTAGKAYTGQSGAGIQLSVGTVTGFVYVDVNGDGVYTARVDEPASDVTVRVTDAYGIEHTTTTGVDGAYTAAEVGAGYATVTLVNPPAGAQTQGTNPTPVLVSIGVTTFEEDNGFYRPTAIGNRVWLDENSNGIQDAGEPGLANITVQLWNSDHSALLATTVTDADGHYVFKGVPAGTYQVDVLDSSLPTGLTQSKTTGTGDFTNKADPYSMTIAAGQENMTADFGYNWAPSDNVTDNTGTGAIGDRVWSDANGDGKQDPGELGLSGVTVELWYDSNGDGEIDALYASTTTNATGNYAFTALPAGIYEVHITAGVIGATQTGDPDGTLDGKTTQPIVLAPGDVFVNVDFGYQPGAGMGATIGDTLWLDANANGAQDSGETGIPGVTVALIGDTNGNGVWDPGEPILASTITDADGAYQFTGVPVSGYYLVWVNDTANVLGGLAPSYDSDGVGTPHISAVSALPASGNNAQDFGYKPFNQTASAGLIGDTLFLDRDNNGVYTAGEGLEGVTVRLYDSAGTTILATTVTDENGRYTFAGLPAGTYVVKVDTGTLPAGLTNTVDPDGGMAHQATVTLAAGEINLAQDFGYQGGNSVSGTLWNDVNADGYLDAGETVRFAGVTVALYDANGNVIATTVTDGNGDYTFAYLPNGTYTVKVTDHANVLEGAWHSLGTADTDGNSQSDPLTVILTGSTVITYADFGYYREAASLGNLVWVDDGDGIQESGEPGLAGVLVTLTITWPGGETITTTILTTLTDANGTYRFDNLLLDENFNGTTADGSTEPTFTISVATPAGYFATKTGEGTPATDSDNHTGVAAIVAQGEFKDTYDFGFVRIVLSGTITPEALEITAQPGDTVSFVQRWTVTGNVTDCGNITVYGIPAGWDVKVYRYTGATPPNTGAYSGASDCPSADCVLLATESAGDRSILDNNDAIESGPDTGNDDVPDSGDLNPPGGETTIVLVVTVPANASGGVFTLRERGSSNYDWVAKKASHPTLPYNDDSVFYDEAFKTVVIPSATVGDRVWLDVDGDGVQDVGEPGLPNVTVWLYNPGTDGQPGGGDDVLIATTTTDANGNYLFSGVTAGSYYVQVDASTLPAGLTASPGTSNPTATFAVTGGNAYLDKDFGYKNASTENAIIGDFVWSDHNQNGIQDPGEPGVAGVSVALKDSGGNTVATTTTGPDGRYLFTDVAPGQYRVEITLPSGYLLTSGPQSSANPTLLMTAQAGGVYLNADFGLYSPATYAISDRLWRDNNFNGVVNSNVGETGIGGVTVNLLDSAGKVIATTTSGPDGTFTFSGVPNGDYTIQIADNANALSGLSATTPAAHAGQLAVTVNGAPVAGEHFGYARPGAIGSRVWQDTDGNGMQDPGEPGLAGVTVALYTDPNGDGNPADGVLVGTQTTGPDGRYLFTGLPDGNYVVVVTPPSGYTQTGDPDESGLCATCDHQTAITLAGGVSFLNADFGYYADLADISGVIWNDLNANGAQNAGEPYLAGVTLALLNSSGAVVATTVTAADGSYTFYDVPAGNYTVQVTDRNNVLAGYTVTTAGGDTRSVTVGTTDVTGVNFGYTRYQTTAVDLVAFSAEPQGNAIRVTWETAQELDNLGFNLYRGESAAGPWTRLNAELIPAQNPGATFGATYEWLDADVTPDATYFYRLEDVDIYGASTFHGPVSTTAATPSAVRITGFGARGPAFGLPLALAALGLWGLAHKRRR
ncbi:MAG TPA: SdrD B-like domain-containing protein [Anaerolineae bacterium]|nr:SdrD B-like domain-containing protein [Anaerolineae bacterium]